jgi:hypothetical protein
LIRRDKQHLMTSTLDGDARGRRPGVLLLPLAVLLTLLFGAATYVGYVLWPRWLEPPLARDAPPLPITVAGVAFNVPPAALRVPVQRRPGAHERIDLSYLWPSLEPPDPAAGAPPAATRPLERLFVTIAAAGDAMPPTERVKTIYPRYAVPEPVAGPGSGLAVLAFRAGTPYQGEDLVYDGDEPDRFLVRCTRNGTGGTPGTCLYERRIEKADLVVRFPRDWLDDWRSVASGIDRLIKSLRPLSG